MTASIEELSSVEDGPERNTKKIPRTIKEKEGIGLNVIFIWSSPKIYF
jgi:hypothetical protein